MKPPSGRWSACSCPAPADGQHFRPSLDAAPAALAAPASVNPDEMTQQGLFSVFQGCYSLGGRKSAHWNAIEEGRSTMAYNGFVNFGDIKGESTDKDHKDWVAMLKYDHAITQAPSVLQRVPSGRSAEAVSHSEFSIGKMLDAATPKLHEAACKGTHIPEVIIEVWRAAGDKPFKVMEYKLKEVLISGVVSNGDPATPAGFPTETIRMTYGAIEWSYTKQKPDGTGAGNVSAKWSVAQGAAG